jgi:flavin-binding protein dodecin
VAERTYALTEVVGTSKAGVDEAIQNAVTRLSKTVENLDWFEVTQIRGYIRDGAVDHYQVTLKIGSRLKDA